MSQDNVVIDIEYFVDNFQDDAWRIRQAAGWIAQRFELRELRASLSIVDDATIQQLNRERLGHDWATDVISFVIERQGAWVDGEVIASGDMAQRLCSAAGWSAEDELLLYIVHGLLHIAGLDDRQPADCQAMRDAERACLMAIGVRHAGQLAERWNDVSH